jgi:hypothetical protein
MATTLKGKKPGARGSLRTGKDGVTYTETHEYIVISDVKDEDPWTVLTTTGLPLVMVTSLSGLVCVGKEPQQDAKSPYVWTVACEFSADTNGQETDEDPDPKTWIPIWSSALETYDEVLMKDKTTPTPQPYLNSALCKFPEPLVQKSPIVVWEFVQYEADTLDLDEISDRNESTNDDTFKGFPVDTLKLNVVRSTRGYYFGYSVYKLDYRIAYKKDNWLDKPLDMGYEYFNTSGAGKKKLVSDFLVALNSDGTKKADDATPVVNKEFRNLTPLDFSSFLR